MERVLVVHHDDLDGRIGGCICKNAYPDADTLELDYDNLEQIPAKEYFNRYSLVFIVDYSFSPDLMKSFSDSRRVVWIDHHVSAINDSKKYKYDDMYGIRRIGSSGAELAWIYFHGSPLPDFVRLVGDYDTFRSASDKKYFELTVLPFFYGCMSLFDRFVPADFDNGDFLGTDKMFQNDFFVDKIIRSGSRYYKFLKGRWKENYQNAFVRELFGCRVLCMNSAENGSLNMDELFDASKHDMMLKFSFNGKRWCYGLYTRTDEKPGVDVSVIAKSFGGGGHAGAAGFTTDKLIDGLT